MINNPADFQKAKKEAKNFADQATSEAKGKLTEAVGNIKENFRNSQFGRKIQDKFENAGEVAREYGEQVRDQVRDKAGEVIDYVEREAKAKPFKTAGVAFVAGLITALLFRRRR